MKKSRMEKNIRECLVLIFMVLILGCSSVGKRTVPESSVVGKREIVDAGIEEIARKYSELVSRSNVGLYKKGYRDWKLVLYGTHSYYVVFVSEDGKIVSSEKKQYDNK